MKVLHNDMTNVLCVYKNLCLNQINIEDETNQFRIRLVSLFDDTIIFNINNIDITFTDYPRYYEFTFFRLVDLINDVEEYVGQYRLEIYNTITTEEIIEEEPVIEEIETLIYTELALIGSYNNLENYEN